MAANPQKVRQAIDNAIKSSDDLKPGNYISVSVEKEGFLFFGKKKILVSGRAASEKDKEKIQEIAKQNAQDLDLEFSIRIGRSA